VTPTIGLVRSGELGAVRALLTAHHLPLDGLEDHVATLLVARQDDAVVGSAALEVYRDGALLRSVVVSADLQGRGLWRDLTDAAIRMARDLEVAHIFLLTTTAEGFFPKFGFDRIDRRTVPASVQQSAEFRGACPSSAVVMRKSL